MCRPDSSTSRASAKAKEEPQKSAKGTQLLPPPKLRLSQFFDINEPWVLVPNGSFRGHFDNVPEVFRVGPWNIACCLYLFALVYWIIFDCVQCYNDPPKVNSSDYVYFATNTWQWKYNAAGFAWTLFIAKGVAQSDFGLGAWATYTLQSWTLITIRHGLSTLAPFFPALTQYNEYLRFAMLLQTSIVFLIWNFALLPAICMTIKKRENRINFLKFCFGFNLSNLHILNLPLALMNGVFASPSRELNQIDFCVALVLALQYITFYLLFLDRIGVHLYFIFSPRTPLALVSWSALFGCIYGGFSVAQNGILQYGISAA